MPKLSNIHLITRNISLGIGYGAVATYALLEGISLQYEKGTFPLRNTILLRGMGNSLEKIYDNLSILELWDLISIKRPYSYVQEDGVNEYTILELPKCSKKYFTNKMALMQHRNKLSATEAQAILQQFDKLAEKKEPRKVLNHTEVDLKEWGVLNWAQYLYEKAGLKGVPTMFFMARIKAALLLPFKDKGNTVIKAFIDDIFDVYLPKQGRTGEASPEIVFAPKLQEMFFKKQEKAKLLPENAPVKARPLPMFFPKWKQWTFSAEELEEFAKSEKTPEEQKHWDKQLEIEKRANEREDS